MDNQLINVISATELAFSKSAKTHKAGAFAAECQFAMQLIQNNDYLEKIALENQQSLHNAVMNLATIGISLNPAERSAYLVPRKGSVCLDISYIGLIYLATNSGVIEWVQAKVVYALDDYKSGGIDRAPKHIYSPFEERGEVVGAYVTAKLVAGDYLTHEMSVADIFAIRDRSESWKRGKKGPWASDCNEMIKKTVVKQASKYWPKSNPRLAKAIDVLNTDAGEGIAFDKERATATVQAPSNYPEADFEKNFPLWQELVASHTKTPEQIIAKLESKGLLTDTQKHQILNIGVVA